jgi:DNA-binding NarL/FixJ family response regulator
MWCSTGKTADASGVAPPESSANPGPSPGLKLGWVGHSEGLPTLVHAVIAAAAGAIELAARYPTLKAFGDPSGRQVSVQVLLVDLDLTPDALPIASSSLSRIARATPVVVVTSTVDSGHLSELVAAGACVLCASQDVTFMGLMTAIQSAVAGGLHFSRTLAPHAIELLGLAHRFRGQPTLSSSEQELLNYLANTAEPGALRVKIIAEAMGKAPQTISNRLAEISRKLGGVSREQAVDWWRQHSRPNLDENHTGIR